MKKVELLAPSGDLERLKIAVIYGADAVYIGGKQFSLRSRASNFSIDDIAQGVLFAKKYGAKVMVTTNIIPHEDDFEGLKEYFQKLQDIGVFAVICASYAVAKIALEVRTTMEVHLSTQNSSTTSSAIKFWKQRGIDRVVLARELTDEDIDYTMKNSDLDVEVFIHGGMCSSYSGRCTLSNSMTARDANRGGCAQSCRWKYHLYDNGVEISDPNDLFSMSSKDLAALEHLPKLLDLGVTSLKIEGRMKSAYYIAVVVGTYRKFIDEYYEKGTISPQRMEYYRSELARAENRLSHVGFFKGTPTAKGHLYGRNGAGVIQDYVARVIEYNEDTQKVVLQVRNHFNVNEQLEVFSPHTENRDISFDILYNEDDEIVEIANKPMQILYGVSPIVLKPYDMIRKRVQTERKDVY